MENSKKTYQAPTIEVQEIALEQGIAAGSAMQESYTEGEDDNRTFTW
ncbi:MAG: hypothetical protein ACN6PI_08765 [Sphingobacterium siyangense]